MKPIFRFPFGKFQGVAITRVPLNYLRWCVRQEHQAFKGPAERELSRRDSLLDDAIVVIADHAINRASTRLIGFYMNDSEPDEGLHSWLQRKAIAALDAAETDGYKVRENMRVEYQNVVWIFGMSHVLPVLISVWNLGDKEEDLCNTKY